MNKDVICFCFFRSKIVSVKRQSRRKNFLCAIRYIKNKDITKKKTSRNRLQKSQNISTLKTVKSVLAVLAFRMPLYGRGWVQEVLTAIELR